MKDALIELAHRRTVEARTRAQERLVAWRKSSEYLTRVKSHFTLSLATDDEITGEELAGDDSGNADYETALQLAQRADNLRIRLLNAVIEALDVRLKETTDKLNQMNQRIEIAKRVHGSHVTRNFIPVQEPTFSDTLLVSGIKAAIVAIPIWLLVYAITWCYNVGSSISVSDELRAHSVGRTAFWPILFFAVVGNVAIQCLILIPKRRRRICAMNARARLGRDAAVGLAEAEWRRTVESLQPEQQLAEKALSQIKTAIDGCIRLGAVRRVEEASSEVKELAETATNADVRSDEQSLT